MQVTTGQQTPAYDTLWQRKSGFDVEEDGDWGSGPVNHATLPNGVATIHLGESPPIDSARASAFQPAFDGANGALMRLFVSPLDEKRVRDKLWILARKWLAELCDLGDRLIALRFENRSTSPGEPTDLSGSLIVVMRLFARQRAPAGTVVGATFSNDGNSFPEAHFQLYLSGVANALKQTLRAVEATPETIRTEVRVPIRCPVALVPAAGALRNLKIPCTALNLSGHGVGLASTMALDPGAVRLQMMGLLRGHVVRCHRGANDKCYTIGVKFADTAPPVDPELLGST